MALKKESVISQEALSQLKSNFFSNEMEEAPKKAVTIVSDDKKPDYSDTYILRLPKGERSRIKAFCASKEVSMSSFIMFSIDHLMSEVEEGRATVSKTGVKVNKVTV